MRFENVSALIDAVGPEAGAMGFHWRDQRGMICNQKSVFRVNCMDCLDRTNVVQTAIGKAVLESQLVKLGLSPPYTPIPEQLKSPFMVLWANNGDIISRQYAGTNALKVSRKPRNEWDCELNLLYYREIILVPANAKSAA